MKDTTLGSCCSVWKKLTQHPGCRFRPWRGLLAALWSVVWAVGLFSILNCNGKLFFAAPHKSVVDVINPCNPLNVSGTCNDGQVCVQGVCYKQGSAPPVCSKNVNGVCANAGNACIAGVCTPITSLNGCAVANPNGLCPGGQLCALGYCYTDNGLLGCSSSNPQGLCPGGNTCVNGLCQAFVASCDAGNFSGTCATWQACAEGTCVGPVPPNGCTSQNLDGICPANEVCVAGNCTSVTASNVCNANNLLGLCASGSSCVRGLCQAITTSNICSSSQPSGLCQGGGQCSNGKCLSTACGTGGWQCSSGQTCIQNTCVPIPCDPVHPAGDCLDATQACVQGICTTPPCSSQNPNGACPTGLICDGTACNLPPCSQASPNGPCPQPIYDQCVNGTCVPWACSALHTEGICTGSAASTCTNDPNYGCVYSISAQCCDAALNQSTGCQLGSCSPPACSANNPHGACSTGQYCINDGCQTAPCSPFYQSGFCTLSTQKCFSGSCVTFGCNQQPNPDASCAPEVCDRVNNVCQQTPCSAQNNSGYCPVGQTCCNADLSDPNSVDYNPACNGQTGICVQPSCSVLYPGGVCANANQVCAAGTCKDPPCSSTYVHGTCGSNFSCQNGNCTLLPCALSAGRGSCPSGQSCVQQSNQQFACEPYVCNNYFPQAPCIGANAGQICVNLGGFGNPNNYQCQTPACSLTYPGGACSNPNTPICFDGSCVAPACSPTHPQGVCPRSQTCTNGYCMVESCAVADPNDNGTCPSSQTCCNNSLIAQNYCTTVQQCVNIVCSSEFPLGSCTDPNQVCISGQCENVCNANHPLGVCPTGLACVNKNCATPCNNDQDCDYISDAAEGRATLVDTDGDGVPDYLDKDSDGDGIPDYVESGYVASEAKPISNPIDTNHDGIPDFRSLDSDGDFISDTLEAGANPKIPLDTTGRGIPNYRNIDSDGDGILDRCEATDAGGICQNRTLITLEIGLASSDGDNIPDYLDLDSDADGILDTIEARQKPADANTLNPNGVDHDGDGIPDYRDLDSDNDTVLDKDEDVNGNGVVDCQLDGTGNTVVDTRLQPLCGTTSAPFSVSAPYDYNPGCNTTPSVKCLFSETNRIVVDTDGNSILDNQDGIFLVCATSNLKPINVFYSSQADYAYALETNYTQINYLTQNSNQFTVGMRFDDPNQNNGSYPVSGFIMHRSPGAQAVATTNGTNLLVQKSAVQAQADLSAWFNAQSVQNQNNVTVVINRSFSSYDGYGVTITTYNITTNSSISTGQLRDNLVYSLNSSLDSFTSTQQGPSSTSFTLTTQTLYRADPNGATPGVVLTVGALVQTGADQNTLNSYNYRSNCSLQTNSSLCGQRVGCVWNTTSGSCVQSNHYQIPLFYMDNISNGSALTQYGDDLSHLCASFVQKNGLVDFLWTVDNSGSMASKIGQVNDASSLFFGLLKNSEADYRVSFTTTSAVGHTMPPLLDACVGNGATLASCNQATNGGCSVDNVNNICVEVCTPYTSQSSCAQNANQGCVWNNQSQACVWGGCSTLTTQAACGNTATGLGCTWSNGQCGLVGTPDLINGHIINFTGAIAGQVDLNSIDREATYACSQSCTIGNINAPNVCSQYTNITGNANNNMLQCLSQKSCQWINNQCTLSPCCPACASNPTAVPNDPACYFAARLPNDSGSGSSGAEYGLALTEQAIFKAGGQPICVSQSTAAACSNTPGCLWNNNVCIPGYCNNLDTTSVNAITGLVSNDQNQCNGWNPTGSNDNYQPVGHSGQKAQWDYEMPAYCEWFAGAENGPMCYPSMGNRCIGLSAANCAGMPDKCTWVGNATSGQCQPLQPPAFVMCNGQSSTECLSQGKGRCAWDTCTAYSSAVQCEAVYGCQWSNAACTPIFASAGGTCRPSSLKQMLRNNAQKISIILSDEDECYLKDGPYNNASYCSAFTTQNTCQVNNNTLCKWCPDPNNTSLCYTQTGCIPYDAFAYDGYCAQNLGLGGFFAYNDPVRISRVNSYRDFLLSRGFTSYTLVGDAANESLAPFSPIEVTNSGSMYTPNGGCHVDHGGGHIFQADSGQAYVNVARDTGGGWGSICAIDLFPAIETAVLGGLAQASPYKLAVSVNGQEVQPISSTIEVAVQVCSDANQIYPNCPLGNTQVLVAPRARDNGFDYDAINNTLLLYGQYRAYPQGSITVSYRYFINNLESPWGNSVCPCPGATPPSCECPAGTACGISANGQINHCTAITNPNTCVVQPGCSWNTAIGCEVNGLCAPDPTCGNACTEGTKCDSLTGLCVCDPTCGSVGGCVSGSVCNTDTTSPTCGTCACDTTCNGGCPTGQICDSTLSSSTCGQCACDTTCNGSCTAHETCNSNTASASCGLCGPKPCGECDTGYVCNNAANICVCDTTCGSTTAPSPGTICDPNTTSVTCGQFICDVTCGGGCSSHQLCDSNIHSATCGLCSPDPTCGGPCTPSCQSMTDPNSCLALSSNCQWKLGPANTEGCYAIVCESCNSLSGICVTDETCAGCGCNSYQQCNTSTGRCDCDTTCGGTSCQSGQLCDTNTSSATCGQCLCDLTCGGVTCPAGQLCNQNTTSSTCGLCVVDTTCGGSCAFPLQCNTATGFCVPNSQCGSCPTGFVCNTATGKCQSNGG